MKQKIYGKYWKNWNTPQRWMCSIKGLNDFFVGLYWYATVPQTCVMFSGVLGHGGNAQSFAGVGFSPAGWTVFTVGVAWFWLTSTVLGFRGPPPGSTATPPPVGVSFSVSVKHRVTFCYIGQQGYCWFTWWSEDCDMSHFEIFLVNKSFSLIVEYVSNK